MPPTSGHVSVAGFDVVKDGKKVKTSLGVVPQELALYEDLPARENLVYWGKVSGLGVLMANGLAALGGCWWPIEVTPQWMQTIMPTGWTMDAMHKLISFQYQ